jgi:hypothetical protein
VVEVGLAKAFILVKYPLGENPDVDATVIDVASDGNAVPSVVV